MKIEDQGHDNSFSDDGYDYSDDDDQTENDDDDDDDDDDGDDDRYADSKSFYLWNTCLSCLTQSHIFLKFLNFVF